MKKFKHAAIVGKFLPPTRGHTRMIAFARELCEHVTVIVDNVFWQDVDAATRAEWIRHDFGDPSDVTVVSLPYPMPQEPGDHPDFWPIWRRTMLDGAEGADVLIASETYGIRLAAEMGVIFMPYDIGRESGPISATLVRERPWPLWHEIIAPARSHYLKRIALEGPESTGKTTIAKAMAHDFDFAYSPEWAKGYIEHAACGRSFQESDLTVIARAQLASETVLEPGASRAIVYDSTILTTIAWGHFLYGRSDPEIDTLLYEQEKSFGQRRQRIFLKPDVPFHPAPHRNVAPDGAAQEQRDRFLSILIRQADRRGLEYELVGGSWGEREAAVHMAIAKLRAPAMAQKA